MKAVAKSLVALKTKPGGFRERYSSAAVIHVSGMNNDAELLPRAGEMPDVLDNFKARSVTSMSKSAKCRSECVKRNIKNNADFKAAALAIEEDNHLELQKLLSENQALATFKSVDDDGSYLIHKAAFFDRPLCYDVLVQHGAVETVCNDDGDTVLHVAVMKNNVAFLEHVIRSFPLVNKTNNNNHAPIHLAVLGSNFQLVKILLSNLRVDVMSRGDRGGTPLHYAAEKNLVEIAEYLMSKGAYPCVTCSAGYTSIHCAILCGCREVLNSIVDHCALFGYTKTQVMNFCDKNLNTPLHVSVSNGDIESVRICLDYGAKITCTMEDESSAIHLAATLGNKKILSFLLENAQHDELTEVLSSRDLQGLTPLHCAAMFNQLESARLLVEKGSPINLQNLQGYTPLMLAASVGSVQVLDYLKDVTDLTAKDCDGRNLAHLSMLHYNDATCQLLEFLKEGVEATTFCQMLGEKDDFGCTAVHYAVLGGSLKRLDWLLKCSHISQTKSNLNEFPLHYAARLGRYNACVNLLSTCHGNMMLNSRNSKDRTPIMLAAASGYTKVVKLFISRGALLVHSDTLGNTVLHYAAMGGYTHTMRLLLDTKGTLIDMSDHDLNTALHKSAEADQPNSIKLLLDQSCALTLNEYGQSALDLAIDGKNRFAIEAFVKHDRWVEIFTFFGPDQNPPFQKLLADMPEVAQVLMDKSIETSQVNPNCPDFWVRFNFTFFMQKYNEETFSPEQIEEADAISSFRIFDLMAEYGQENLMTHPLCTSFMDAKWERYGSMSAWSLGFFYLINLVVVTVLGVDKIMRVRVANNLILRDPEQYKHILEDYILEMSMSVTVCLYILLAIAICDIFAMTSGVIAWRIASRSSVNRNPNRHSVIFNTTTMSELGRFTVSAILSLAFCLVIIIPHDVNHLNAANFYIIGVLVFLSWYQVLDILHPFSNVGIYLVMYHAVLLSTCKLLIIFSSLIFGFALSFQVFFGALQYTDDQELRTDSFSNLISSLGKLSGMMLGELDMSSKFLPNYEHGYLNWVDLCFVCSFILLVCILFVNLTIGLAVGDIAQLKKQSKVKGLQNTTVFYKFVENLFRCMKCPERAELPPEKTIYFSKLKCVFHKRRLLDSLASKNEEAEMVKLLKTIRHDVDKNNRKVKKIEASLFKTEELVGMLVSHMDLQNPYLHQDEGKQLLSGFKRECIVGILNGSKDHAVTSFSKPKK